MPRNHRFLVVLCGLSSKWHFRAVSVKFSLNPIPAQKMTNLKKTVRRLIIIVLSLFFLLIIRASILRPYGKNLADPRYHQKDDQFAKYSHTLLRIHRVIWCLLANRHFKLLLSNSPWIPLRRKRWPICEILSNAAESSFSGSILLLIISATFWSSYCEILAKPHCGPKYGPFLKHCHRRFIYGFPLVYLCVSWKQHFGVLTVKFLLKQITTYKMASFENIVTTLRIIILCYSYSAYHQNDTLELLPWNCQLTPLWRKRYPICKILSHASKLSFSFSYLVLIV